MPQRVSETTTRSQAGHSIDLRSFNGAQCGCLANLNRRSIGFDRPPLDSKVQARVAFSLARAERHLGSERCGIVRGISANMSASGLGSTEIPARPVPTQFDRSPHCGNAVCSPNTAKSFARRRVPAGTESAPVHRQPDGKGGRRSSGDHAALETESHSLLLSVSRHPK